MLGLMKRITVNLMERNTFLEAHHSNGKMEVICARSIRSRFNPVRPGYTVWMVVMR